VGIRGTCPDGHRRRAGGKPVDRCDFGVHEPRTRQECSLGHDGGAGNRLRRCFASRWRLDGIWAMADAPLLLDTGCTAPHPAGCNVVPTASYGRRCRWRQAFQDAIRSQGCASSLCDVIDRHDYLLLLLSEPHRSPEPCSAQKPAAEIPIGQPTKLEVVINLRTAKALALTIPSLMRMRAHEMIGVRIMTVISTLPKTDMSLHSQDVCC